MTRRSSTLKRKTAFYPTPQIKDKLNKATLNPDGSKKDNISKNKLINVALERFFATGAII